jgi:CRP-like cAMP-binding protein
MKNNAFSPFGSEETYPWAESLYESFLSEPYGSAYGWGPTQTYPAHVEIFKQGTPSSAVYFIEKGSVKLTWMDEEGHEVIAGLRHRHWIVGAPAVLLRKAYSFTVTTLTPCVLRCISAQDFLHLVETNGEFSQHLIRLLSQAIFNHGRSLVMMGCTSAKERLKDLLCKFIPDKNQEVELHDLKIHLPLKNKELAEILAVTPEHLSRLLKELEREKLIRREKGGLILVNPHFLRSRHISAD